MQVAALLTRCRVTSRLTTSGIPTRACFILVTSKVSSARRVKAIRKNIIPSMTSLLCMGLFLGFEFADHRASQSLLVAHAYSHRSRLHADRPSPDSCFEVKWSEREDLNLRPLVSQTSALTGLRHAPNVVPLARIGAMRKARPQHFAGPAPQARNRPQAVRTPD